MPPELGVPAVLQLEDPVAGGGAGGQIEPVGLGDAVEQPGALARNVGEPSAVSPAAMVVLDHSVSTADQQVRSPGAWLLLPACGCHPASEEWAW